MAVAPSTTAGRFDLARADEPSSDLEKQLFDDAADGLLDALSPLDAALIASGVTDAESLRHYEQEGSALVDALRRCCKRSRPSRELAVAVFEFMHRRVLRGGYHIDSTDLRATLDQGRFNCVTASILFNYLAAAVQLECRGIETPGHAMSRVVLADGALDVETTCPGWFRMVADPEKRAETAGSKIGAKRAAVDPSKLREVSPIQMAAMVYYNRGVDLLGEKRFAEAAVANAKAARLDRQNATARGNLLATLNNWSIELGSQDQYGEAIDLLRQGLSLEPKYEAFTQNYVHVHHQWVEQLCRDGRYDEALDVLSRAETEMPHQENLRRIRSEVSQRLAQGISDLQGRVRP